MTQVQIARLAKLTALQADQNIEIDSVLDSFKAIESIDTNAVSEVTRSGADTLNPQKDEVICDAALPDKLLDCSPQKIAAHQVVLSGIMHGE